MMTSQFGRLAIHQLPCLTDNYGFILRDEETGTTACIDTPDAKEISAVLDEKGWDLDLILNTHWHADHTGGNHALKKKYGAVVMGPADEGDRIPERDRALQDNDEIKIGSLTATVIATPGHTLGHIIYHFAEQNVAFVGDTLFSLGCGRLFEGTAEQMWGSLKRVRALPPETTVFCAHEYTAANARFARHIDPRNPYLKAREQEVGEQRRKGHPTVPMRLSDECRSNPFLRADEPDLTAALGMSGQAPHEVFAALRAKKDMFS